MKSETNRMTKYEPKIIAEGGSPGSSPRRILIADPGLPPSAIIRMLAFVILLLCVASTQAAPDTQPTTLPTTAPAKSIAQTQPTTRPNMLASGSADFMWIATVAPVPSVDGSPATEETHIAFRTSAKDEWHPLPDILTRAIDPCC